MTKQLAMTNTDKESNTASSQTKCSSMGCCCALHVIYELSVLATSRQ